MSGDKLIVEIYSGRITLPKLHIDEKTNKMRLIINKNLLEYDCLFNIFSYSLCSTYLFYADDKYFDLGLLERSLRNNLLSQFIEDLILFGRIRDFVKFHVKYILYKKLYELMQKFRDIDLLKTAGYRYLNEENQRIRIIDLSIKKLLEMRDTDQYIDKEIISRILDKYKDLPTDLLIRARIEWGKLISSMNRLSSVLEKSINPVINILKEIRFSKDLMWSPPRPETLIVLHEGSVLKGVRIPGRAKKEGQGSLVERFLGSISSAKIKMLRENNREYRVVEKRYLNISSVKWFFSTPVIELLKKIGIRLYTDPLERLSNDYYFSIILREMGLRTARTLFLDPWNYVLVRDYIEGINIAEYISRSNISEEEIREVCGLLGNQISMLHSKDICLGDTNPRNFIVVSHNGSKELFYIDLEQTSFCKENIAKTWDLSTFVYFMYLIKGVKKDQITRKCFKYLLNSYKERYFNEEVIRKIDDPLFFSIFISGTSLIFSPIVSASVYKAYSLLSEVKREILEKRDQGH
jgi:tRNA A-37 threonylcarbamoyl transferase component Bud32